MKHLILICCLSCLSIVNQGQELKGNNSHSYPNNSIYIEIGGNSVFFGSLNYERVFINKNFFYFSGRTGIGYGNFLGRSILSAPILLNGIFQIYHSLAFEAGVGVSLMQVGTEKELGGGEWIYKNEVSPAGHAGIRVQAKNGFLLRIDFTPFIADLEYESSGYKFYPSLGLSLGYSFGKKKN
jgi:hypothetical protein